MRAEAAQLLRLLGRQGGAHRSDRLLDAGPHERQVVEVALDEHDAVVLADGLASFEEAVEQPLLREDRRLGRVQVLRLALRRERAAAESHRAPAVVAHDEDQPVAEAVIRALALRARLEQAGLDQQVFRVRRRERLAERVPGVGRVAEAERRPHLDRHAAPLEVRRGRVARPREPLGEEALRGRERLEEPVAPVVARAAALAARDRHAEARREHLDGFGELQAIDLAHEVDDVAPILRPARRQGELRFTAVEFGPRICQGRPVDACILIGRLPGLRTL